MPSNYGHQPYGTSEKRKRKRKKTKNVTQETKALLKYMEIGLIKVKSSPS